MSQSTSNENVTSPRTKVKVLVALSVILLSAVWLGYEWLQARHQDMSEKPERSSTNLVFEPHESTLVANLSVAYPVIQRALNTEAVKVSGTKQGSEDIRCVSSNFPRFRECLTVNWNVSYAPSREVGVGRSGELVRITLPAKFSGGAGFGGEIAKILSLNNKSFDGSFVVTSDLSLRLDERFCPRLVPGKITFNWETPARVEMIGRNRFRILGIGFDVGPWHLDVGSHFEHQIQAELNKAVQSAGDAIPCEPVRAELQKLWRGHSIPLVSGDPSVFLHAVPVGLGASGLIADDQGLRLVAMLKTKVQLANVPGAEDGLGELPVHASVAPQAGILSMALPVRVDYLALQAEAMKQLDGQTFVVEGPGGTTQVAFRSVEIYPSGETVTVGVGFSADLPNRLFDTSGTVWLSARPTVDSDGRVLGLADVKLTRQLDNVIWNSLSAAFQETIHAQIQEAVRFDVSMHEKDAISAVQAAVADPAKTGGVRLAITEPSIRFGRVHVGESAFTIEALFDAGWSAVLEDVKL